MKQCRRWLPGVLRLWQQSIHAAGQFGQPTGRAPAEYWIWDGIHPMPAGHELMAREWMRQVSRGLKFIK